jgi:hypothetical protein
MQECNQTIQAVNIASKLCQSCQKRPAITKIRTQNYCGFCVESRKAALAKLKGN